MNILAQVNLLSSPERGLSLLVHLPNFVVLNGEKNKALGVFLENWLILFGSLELATRLKKLLVNGIKSTNLSRLLNNVSLGLHLESGHVCKIESGQGVSGLLGGGVLDGRHYDDRLIVGLMIRKVGNELVLLKSKGRKKKEKKRKDRVLYSFLLPTFSSFFFFSLFLRDFNNEKHALSVVLKQLLRTATNQAILLA